MNKNSFFTLLLLLLPFQCLGQKYDCSCYEIITFNSYTKDSLTKSGFAYKGRLIEGEVTYRDSLYTVKFGDKSHSYLTLPLKCHKNQKGKPFNGKINNKRSGIWLRWHPWGGIRKVIYYQSGQKKVKAFFRTNQTISLVVLYKYKSKYYERHSDYKKHK